MTLADIKKRLTQGVGREDLATDYVTYINEAQDEICRRRSWLAMKKLAVLTILAGTSSIALPTDYKELTTSRSPVHYTDPTTGFSIEVEVMTRERRIRVARFIPLTGYRAFIDDTTTPKTLNVYDKLLTDLAFEVSYYGFPAALAVDGDSNFLTTNYPEMLIAKSKAIAFVTVNDPMAGDLESLFEKKFSEARKDDSFREIAGRTLRM